MKRNNRKRSRNDIVKSITKINKKLIKNNNNNTIDTDRIENKTILNSSSLTLSNEETLTITLTDIEKNEPV